MKIFSKISIRKKGSKKIRNFVAKSLSFSLMLFFFLFIASTSAYAATYYVSTTGQNTNNGTSIDTPWAHHPWDNNSTNIAQATTLVSGDEVLFNKGDTFNSVSITVDEGGATSHIVTGSYGNGAKPIINGGSTYTINTYGRDNLTFQDLDLRSNSVVSVVFIQLSSSNVTIQRNDIKSTTSRGIYVYLSNTILIDSNSIITESGTGVGLDILESNSVTISNNTITNTNATKTNSSLIGVVLKSSESIVINNNIVGTTTSDSYLDCIRLNNTNSSSINNNTLSYCWNGLEYPSMGGHGIYLTASSENNNVYNNFLLESAILDSVSSGNGGNKYYYNTVKNAHVNGIDFRGASTVNKSEVHNNTVIHHPSGTAGHGIDIQMSGKIVSIKNNIITCDVPGLNIQCVTIAGVYTSVEIDNNLYYVTNGSSLGQLDGTDCNTLEEWKQALAGEAAVTLKDLHAVSSDPLFVNTDSNFRLTENSPAINTGLDVGLTQDILGNNIYGTPDIGAYEYQPPYTIGTDEIDVGGGAKVYADGKFRNTQTTSGTTANLSITPVGGFDSGNYSEWMNVTINTWGSIKNWTESSTSIGNASTIHTVGDLLANTSYTVDLDGNLYTTATSNNSGQIIFTYSGGYSSHTFNVYKTPDPAGPPVCSDVQPGSAPWLYGTSVEGKDSILLNFTQVNGNTTKYAIEYGLESRNYIFAADNIGGSDIDNYLVQALEPNTTYYFRVRAGNGCVVGPWSDEISAKTFSSEFFGGFSSPGRLKTKIIEEKKIPAEAGEEKEGYIVQVKVVDKNKEVVEGAKVELYSEPKLTYTNDQGIATFNNVEPGEHTIKIVYDGFSGEEKIKLEGEETKEFDFTIQVKKQTPFLNPLVILAIGIPVIISITLFKRIRRLKKKKTPG